ncbi:MAG: DUF1343 domain-containing protein, partial [Deltaproteobacteria bacterium]|nr:DUF1343 domain-containing protein [Deltaproteobacteria bacterium]
PAIACNLDIVRMENWNRAMYFEETGVPWVLPSPNIPTVNTAVVYPGGCLFEATNISEGRGTTLPFEFIGAPYLDGDALVEAVARENMTLRGATLRSVSFLPLSDKSKGEMCGGIQIHVTNRKEFQSFRWALAIINAIRKLAPSAFAWRGGTYEFVDKVPAIDLLYGNAAFREVVEGHGNLSTLEASLTTFENTYRADRAPFLLYS